MKKKIPLTTNNRRLFSSHCLITILSIFILTGCQNGCTLTKTLKTSTKEVKVGEVPVTLMVVYKKATHYKRNSRKLFDVSRSSAAYYINVQVKIKGVTYDIHRMPAKDKEELQPYLDKVKLVASPNTYYIAAGYSKKIHVVFQKMGQLYNYSPYSKSLENKLFAQADLSTLPNETAFLKDVVNHRVDVMPFGISTKADSAFVDYFTQQDFSQEDCITLLEQWPQKPLVAAYFKPERVKNIRNKYPKWVKQAKEKSGKFLKGNRGFMNKSLSAYIQLFLMLSEQKEIEALDASLAGKWGKTFEDVATAYFMERLKINKSTGIPLAKRYIEQIERKCIKNLKAYPKKLETGNKDRIKEVGKAVTFLLLAGNHQEVQAVLPRILNKETYWEQRYEIGQMVNNNYALFPAGMKTQITAFYESVFYKYSKPPKEEQANNNLENSPVINSMRIAELYNFLRDKVNCEKLKKLRAYYVAGFGEGKLVFLKDAPYCEE